MPQNGITHVGITALADAFTHNPNLRVININDNTFTEVGARSMAKVRMLKKRQNGASRIYACDTTVYVYTIIIKYGA